MQDATAGAAFAGRTVGPYSIGERVGAGGMGEVYRAHDHRLDRQVAVKVLPQTLSRDPQARQRFVRETRLASKIVHPYVATVFDVVEDDDDLLLVMEYLEGRTLRQVMRDDRPSLERITGWAIEIAEALDAIHDAGVIHRDLKPGNVMIAPSGHVKVMDFGVARVVDGARDAADPTLTREGMGVGTVLYMSPEQVRGRDVDARSDLFALGGLLWEAISGEHPFARDSVVETAGAILREPPGGGTEPPSLTQSGPLRDVVLRLLRKEPEERYTSAAEVIEDLRALQRGERPTRTELLATRERRHRWRARAALVGAGVIAAVTLFLLGFSLRPGDGDAPPPTPAPPLIVVLPFDVSDEDSGEGDPGVARASMMASDVLSSILGDRPELRTIPVWRVSEIVGERPPASTERLRRVRDVLKPRWILTGRIYDQDGALLGSGEVLDGRTLETVSPFQVEASGAGRLASLVASRIPTLIGLEAMAQRPRMLPGSDEVLSLFALAKEHVRRMEWVAARDALDRALAIEPDFLDALGLRSQVLVEMGFSRDGLEAVRRAERIAADQGFAPDSVQRLQLRLIEGRIAGPARALEAVDALLAADPGEPAYIEARAGFLAEAGALEEARAAIEQALAIDPSDGRAVLLAADIARRLERDTETATLMTRAKRLFEEQDLVVGRAAALEQGARFAYLGSEFPQARSSYETAATLFEEVGLTVRAARCRKFAADALLAMREFDAARSALREPLPVLYEAGHYPTVIRAKNTDAVLLRHFQGPAEAIPRFLDALDDARSLELEAQELDPSINLAFLWSQTGEPKRAAEVARRAVEIADRLRLRDDRSCAARINLGIALIEDTSIEEGFEALHEVSGGSGCSDRFVGLAWEWIAWYAWVLERPAEALAAADRAIDVHGDALTAPRRGELLADHARILADLGRLDAARALLDEGYELAGIDPGKAGADVSASFDLARRMLDLRAREDVDPRVLEDTVHVRYGTHAWARVLLSAHWLAAGDPVRAGTMATASAEDPWTPTYVRVQATLTRARANLARGDTTTAETDALNVVERAQQLKLPRTLAHACVVLARVSTQEVEAAEWRDRAARAWMSYLDRVPESDRAQLREPGPISALPRRRSGQALTHVVPRRGTALQFLWEVRRS